jgi:hypothetical protein
MYIYINIMNKKSYSEDEMGMCFDDVFSNPNIYFSSSRCKRMKKFVCDIILKDFKESKINDKLFCASRKICLRNFRNWIKAEGHIKVQTNKKGIKQLKFKINKKTNDIGIQCNLP